MKWVWITPIYYDQRNGKWQQSTMEIMLNLEKVKYINKNHEGMVYEIWFIGEGHQDTITISREGFNSLPSLV